MVFNYKVFVKQFFKALFRAQNTHARLEPKRVKFMAVFVFLYPTVWLFTSFCFILDHIFFGDFRNQKLLKPVFIIGNFRSGSTLLHRLMARDTENFASIKSWEIYSALSISQRKFIRGLKMIDGWFFGGYFNRRLHSWENRTIRKVKIHKMGIHEPEEDEGLFFYNWYSLFVWVFFPVELDSAPYHRFDQMISPPIKRRVMRFYEQCIKRHLYFHGGAKHYLTKNPSLTGRIDSLLKYFPDAKIVYLVRNPLENISSQISWFSFAWSYFGKPLVKYPYKEILFDMAKHWYFYPLRRLSQEPQERYCVIKFEDLTTRLEPIMEMIYKRFGLPMTDEFHKIVHATADHSRSFQSVHSHTLEEAGISEEYIYRELKPIFDRFHFPPP